MAAPHSAPEPWFRRVSPARRCRGLVLGFLFLFAAANLWSQLQIQIDPPTDQRLPRRVMPAPSPADPLGLPSPNPGGLGATASFEPPVLRLMRFGEYRVSILGATSGVQLPDAIPTPDGLILDLTDRTPGTTIVNGARVPSVNFRYTVTAAQAGTFIVPSFTATVAGQPITVPATQLIVREPGPDDMPYQSVQAVLDLPPGEYYVGQMLAARLLVFDSPDETVQAIANVTKPSGDFLFQSQPGMRREQVVWQGQPRRAQVTPIRLTPIKPGESAVSLQTIVFINKLNSTGRPSGTTAQAILDTPPVSVTVRPLPEAGRKPGFTGAIGKFSLGRINVTPGEVIVGDPVTLSVTIAGEGNFEAISAPPIEAGEIWQSFTPSVEVERDTLTGQGAKTITYTLIPRRADTRNLPAIPFSYFDPERREYVDLTVPPQAINVQPGKTPEPSTTTTATPTPAPAETPAPKAPEPVLTGLVTKSGGWKSSPSPVFFSRIFWLGQTLPAAALLGLWYYRRRADFLAAHPEIVRRRAARVAARRHLRFARDAAKRSDSDSFVAASIEAIRAAAAPLDTTEAQSLVFEEVLAKLPSGNGAEATVRRLYERTHATQFSGHPVPPQTLLNLLPEVERTVADIEQHQP